jgi:hypothetical protein
MMVGLFYLYARSLLTLFRGRLRVCRVVGLLYLYARSLLTGVFGSEARVTGSVSREAAAVPGPDMYRPLVVKMGDFAAIGNHFQKFCIWWLLVVNILKH